MCIAWRICQADRYSDNIKIFVEEEASLRQHGQVRMDIIKKAAADVDCLARMNQRITIREITVVVVV